MIDIDKELEWVTAWDKEDRHVGVISKHECVVDLDWVEELLTEIKRLREQVKDLEYKVEHWQGELRSRMHPIDYDALVNGGEEE